MTSIEIAVLANDLDVDGDALNLQSAEAEFGVTIMDGSSLNVPDTILYTPQTGFDGLDTITYVVADTSGVTASAVVSVVVDGNQAQKQRMTASIPVLKQPLRWMCWPMTWISMAMS